MFPKYILTTTPCQYSESKTKKTIQYIDENNLKNISQQHLLSNYNNPHGIHKITFVFTNKSLPETQQWKYRLSNKFGSLKIIILSSKSEYSKMSKIRDNILDDVKKIQDLPNIIVMCTHKTRINETLKFINSVPPNGRINLTDIGVDKIIFDIMFDEADKGENISYISDFLKEINKYTTDKKDKRVIEIINFITATPLKSFWNKLQKQGIITLTNMDNFIKKTYFETTYSNYRCLEDHEKQFIDDVENNPIIYIERILKKFINNPKSRIVYAPGACKRSSHEEIKNIFLNEGYDILLINGKNKEFIINFEKITIQDFNIKNKIKGELRDTLIKYRKLNPYRNLVITGNICIERGVTFNTTGFQFTDSIISNIHSKNISSLIQFLGRSNGHIDFCNKHTLWIPKHIYEKAIETIKLLIDIQQQKPEIFTENYFTETINKHVAYTIPILVILTDKEYDNCKKGNKYNSEYLKDLICKKLKDPNIFTYLNIQYEKDQISEPKTDTSYKKNITSNLIAEQNQKPYSIAIKKKNKNKNVYQIWLDYKNKNIILSLYNGTLITNQ